MRIDLKVPYAEKDDAKLLGAKWDVARKVWYIKDMEDLKPFTRWMDARLLKPVSKKPVKQKKPSVQKNEQLALGLDLLKGIADEYKKLPLYDGEAPPWL